MTATTVLRRETSALVPLFLPILVSQYAGIASGVLDSAMAGGLGAVALASIAVGVAVWVPVQVLVLGVVYGLVVAVSQAHGARDTAAINSATQQSLYLGLGVGIAAAGALLLASAHVVLLGVEPEVATLAARYIRAEALGIPVACLMFALRFYCEGQQVVVPVTVISILAIGVKLFFNYAFIHGAFGMPELGVAGCGYATACTNACCLAMLAGYVSLAPRFAGRRLFAAILRPRIADMLRIARTGAPIGLCFVSEFLVFSVMTMFISRHGAAATAAHQVGFNCMLLFFSTATAFAGAACIRVGNLFGAGQAAALRASVAGIVLLSALIGGGLTAGMLLFDGELARAFIDDHAVAPLALAILRVAALFQVVDAMQVSLNGVLRGIGDVGRPFVYTTISYWLLGIPAGYLLSGNPLPLGLGSVGQFGVAGWWLGVTLALVAASALLALRVRAMFWGGGGPVAALEPNG